MTASSTTGIGELADASPCRLDDERRWQLGVAASVLLALTALAGLGCRRAGSASSEAEFIHPAWAAYKKLYLSDAGYVLDRTRNGGEVTSEGQAYMLLRAVWMRDERTFSRVLEWTETHLRRDDGLYSWRWGPDRGGRVLDANTAGDADQEIAFALVLASHAFLRSEYLQRSRALLRAIRTFERLDLPGGWIPSAGNWAVRDRIANLSYFIPYAYPYFARADPEGQWPAVWTSGYDLLVHMRQAVGVRLFPDFVRIRPDGSAELLAADSALSSNFSFDAMRIFWRVALDCQLHKRMRACADPAGTGSLLDLMARDGAVFTRYRVDGTVVDRSESLSFYGAILTSLADRAPASAAAVMTDRLSRPVLDDLLSRADRYYDANWVWFGIAAFDGFIARATPPPEVVFR